MSKNNDGCQCADANPGVACPVHSSEAGGWAGLAILELLLLPVELVIYAATSVWAWMKRLVKRSGATRACGVSHRRGDLES